MDSGGRGRKRRKREKVQTVGRYVKKEFEGYGSFLGKVVSFSEGLYRVDYEDGDFEDLESHEVGEILVNESDFDEEFSRRREKLDELVRDKEAKESGSKSEVKISSDKNEAAVTVGEVSVDPPGKGGELEKAEEMDGDGDGDGDGEDDESSDSSDIVFVRDSSTNEVPIVPPPELPASSGNIGIPEESVSYLFSVYTFLRSFSVQLFLSPFRLDDFVGSLNCSSSNTLLDAVHFCLLRALKRHLEMLSSDGGKQASKCLRRLDWSLLDALTWPVYLVEYLLVMGYAKGPDWRGFYTEVLDGEYYNISVTKKLMILQTLCDDVMESAELRAEFDMRESLEGGSDINGNANPLPINGPRRVHPKYSKTSACKDLEAINAKPYNAKSTHEKIPDSKVPELDTDTTDVDQDANCDECQLCGMDGTLLCCDGCPSAYHARCIGLNKMLIPDGLWFCPECTANKTEPTLRITAGVRGAEIFGTDPYGQIFMGVCNHLLVLDVSTGAGSASRYYSEVDIPKVYQLLCATEQHKTLYLGICKGIMQYWEILEGSILSLPGRTDAEKSTPRDAREDMKASDPGYTLDKQGNAIEEENCISSATISNVENKLLSGKENDCLELQLKSTSMESDNQDNQPVLPKDDGINASEHFLPPETKSCEHLGTESLVSSGSVDHSDMTQQSCAERSSRLDITTSALDCNGDTGMKPIDRILIETKNDTSSMSCENGGKGDGTGTSEGEHRNGSLYIGGLFKPCSYVNQYSLGDIAASAAANFAVLVSEGNGVTEVQAPAKPRKIVSATLALQLKAFASASIRFMWPNSEKRVMEVPRERCGWCLSCKAPPTLRKGCLLNLAASNAIKGSARSTASLRSVRNGNESIPGISTYILYMADSLRGLLVGPFLSLSYRKKWRKQVEEASTCYALKFSLLELEEHIRLVAFSGDWVKLVDDWVVESSAPNATCSIGAPPKRPGGRRNRKQAAVPEVPANPGDDDARIVKWWRGGKLSKLVFQKGILPCSITKKAARQGGRRKIAGIHYAEGSENPKRNRRFSWRAAVEMSRNAPQLALQVRYLDLHLRWNDMVRPEQVSHDGKGADAEISAHRNARISDKKIQENKIRYSLVFNQKHLPSRIMKNSIGVEQSEDGKECVWFSETHVPLFLIKDYEQKAEKDLSIPAKNLNFLSELQRKQLKAFRRNIFAYLMHKEEKVDKCPCASCQENLLLGDAVKCSECEGYCHKDCTSMVDMKDAVDYVVTCNQCYKAKAISIDDSIHKTLVSQLFQRGQDSKMVVAVSDGQPLESSGNTETKSLMKPTLSGRSSASKSRPNRQPASGIIWKKKGSEETGKDFRFSNILHRGNGDLDPSKRPVCYLCRMPYSPNLMYICCEECQLWYHADAVQLNESRIFDVIGFKCHKCRRCRLPACPYEDPENKTRRTSKQRNVAMEPESETLSQPSIEWEIMRPVTKKRRTSKQSNVTMESELEPPSQPPIEWELTCPVTRKRRTSKQHNVAMEPESETLSQPPIEWEITIPAATENMQGILEEDDPLLFSLERVEPISDFTSGTCAEWDTAGASFQGPQKLPIRRQVKLESEITNQKLPIRRFKVENDPHNSSTPPYEESASFEANPHVSTENASPPQVEWEFPVDHAKNEIFDLEGVKFEDMEFEPQTYFSYTELLATDDNQSGLYDASADMADNWVNSAGRDTQSYNMSEQYVFGSKNNQEEFNVAAEPAVDVPCGKCLKPAPDLFCDLCGLCIHKKCSPWSESIWGEGDSWKCGNCRDWA